VVAVSSANLTRGGWWTNLEAADVVRIEDGERHGYVGGLQRLVGQLDRGAPQLADQRATKEVQRFLRRQRAYTTASYDGVVRPTLLPGWCDLPAELDKLFGGRLHGLHLEVISPFHDVDPLTPGAALEGLLSTFQPRSVTLALPVLGTGTPVPQDVYERVAADDRVSWGRIPSIYTRLADGVDTGDRSVHAKVYRFWRGGSDPLEVVAIGSHNLSRAAHSGRSNFEVSVVHEVRGRRQQRFLDPLGDAPEDFSVLDPDGEEAERMTLPLPLSLAYDWETGEAQARWEAPSTPAPVTISRAGETILRVALAERRTTMTLAPDVAGRLRALLRTSCVVTATVDDGAEGPLLVIELNHDLKPALIEGVDLTPAEILALWSIPDLRKRLERMGRNPAQRVSNEPDLEHGDAVPPVPASMFEQFAGVFHAFASLRTRIEEAVADKHVRWAALLLYGQNMDSPSTVLSLVREQAALDPALAYVTYCCARQLIDRVEADHPQVAGELPLQRDELITLVEHSDTLRRELLDSVEVGERDRLERFLDWFDQHFGDNAADVLEVTA
jgi:hypothetical protein